MDATGYDACSAASAVSIQKNHARASLMRLCHAVSYGAAPRRVGGSRTTGTCVPFRSLKLVRPVPLAIASCVEFLLDLISYSASRVGALHLRLLARTRAGSPRFPIPWANCWRSWLRHTSRTLWPGIRCSRTRRLWTRRPWALRPWSPCSWS